MDYQTLKGIERDTRLSATKKAIAKEADRNSVAITHHNEPHFERASRNARLVAQMVERHFPRTFRPEHVFFDGPVAGRTHDFDRSLKGDYIAGKLSDEFLRSFGTPPYRRLVILYADLYHSAAPSRSRLRFLAKVDQVAEELREIVSIMTLTPGERSELLDIISDPSLLPKLVGEVRLILSLAAIGDKSDSQRDRVRKPWMRKLNEVADCGDYLYRFAHADDDSKNWMTNYAILKSRPLVDPEDNGGNLRYRGSLVFHWTLDRRLHVNEHSAGWFIRSALSTVWFRRGMHACENAAQNVLGLNFALQAEFDGEPETGDRWFYSKHKKLWLKHPPTLARTA